MFCNANSLMTFESIMTSDPITLCLKETSHLWLAIIFTYTVRLRQFLAQVLPRKSAIKIYFIFSPHLPTASALPEDAGNPEMASFHLNVACFFTKKTRNTVKNITWSELNHPSLSRWSNGCTREDPRKGAQQPAVCYPHALCQSSLSQCQSPCKRSELLFVKPGVKVSGQY